MNWVTHVSISARIFLISLLLVTVVACQEDFTKRSSPAIQTASPFSAPLSRAQIENLILDGGLISKNPCGPPCFWGILPGVTREDQVDEILNSKNINEICSVYNNEEQSGLRGLDCLFLINISYRKHTDIVEIVSFVPTEEILVSDVIAQYGYPSQILVFSTGLPDHSKSIDMDLYYNDIQSVIDLPRMDGSVYNLSADTKVTAVSYYEKLNPTISEHLQPWNGFGQYFLTK
jgi:hypothetical protein